MLKYNAATVGGEGAMHIEIPDDLTRRLAQCAQGTGQDIDAVIKEALEARVTLEEQSAKNLDGWTEEALQAEIQEGLDDLAHGQYTDYDDASLPQWFENIKQRGRERLKALKNREH
jgi:predicted transcriptional regulator